MEPDAWLAHDREMKRVRRPCVSGQDVVVNRLETQLARLVEQQVLSTSQAEELVDAARADRLDGQSRRRSRLFRDPHRRALQCWRSSGTSEALWYWVR